MPVGKAELPVELCAYFDVEKADGRILRYHVVGDPPCPKCGTRGCKDKIIEGKVNDWYRICQKCGHEFCLIEEIKSKGD